MSDAADDEWADPPGAGVPEDAFLTRAGYCRVGDEAVRVERRSAGGIRAGYDALFGLEPSPVRRVGIALVYLGFVVALAAVFALVPDAVFAVVALAVAAGAWSVYRTRRDNVTNDDAIPVDAIERVVARRGVSPVTRPRFALVYREDGALFRRYVTLPSGLYSVTAPEFERARRLFEARGLRVEDA